MESETTILGNEATTIVIIYTVDERTSISLIINNRKINSILTSIDCWIVVVFKRYSIRKLKEIKNEIHSPVDFFSSNLLPALDLKITKISPTLTTCHAKTGRGQNV